MRYPSNKFYLLLTIIFVTALAGMVYYISPARSQQGAYFSDLFNMNAYDWTPAAGSWAVVNGEYTETVDPSSEEAWSVAGSTSWFDYSVEAKVYSTDSNGTISLAGRWADINNFYALEYSDTGTADSAKLTLYKKVNGVRVNLAQWNRSSNTNVPYIGEGAAGVANNPYPVIFKLKFLGANIEAYVNSTLIGFTSDTSLYYGKIAVGEYNRQAYFDDIYVWDVTPPKISNIAESYITGSTVTIDFLTDEFASHRIDYGQTTSYGSSKVTTVRDLNHSVDISGLTPNTTYHYKITVTDAAGNATSSADRTFTTGATVDTVAPSVYNVAYSSVTANTAVITWNSDEPGNCTVDYGTSPGSYKYSLSYDNKTTEHAVYLSKLTGLTTYYFRVKTRDVAGNIGISPEYNFTTLKDIKPKVTRLITGSTPSVNVTVYWERIPVAVRYKVYVAPDNNWITPDAIINESGQSQYYFNKGSLTANLNYFIKILAEDSVSDSAYTIARAFPPDTNPHGYYWDNPELCQNCHATHTAAGPRLIVNENTDELCVTCHDGSQSKYDVLRGKYKGPLSLDHPVDPGHTTWYDSIAGPYGSMEGKTVEAVYTPTSRHDLNIYNYAATGNNIENVEVADARLSCASCHDPHGSENYRNLRENMQVSLNPSTPLIKTEAYSVTYATYEKTTYVRGAVEFCGACHSDFNQGAGASRTALTTTQQPGMTLSTSSLHKYMHPVNIDAQYVTNTGYHVPVPEHLPYENGQIICQTCHFTHGTYNTGTHTRRDGFPSTVLKRFNETVGCEDCHDKTDHPDE
ncbi:MAG: cytochrome c3 family protein [Bacillota bacterium]